MERGACFDASGAYRYRLWREWDASRPTVAFVMLNPSTADAERDDQTIRRCLGLARGWGFGRLEVVNLCAYRAARPTGLFAVEDPVGPGNAAYISAVTSDAALVVAAWGNHGRTLETPRFGQAPSHLGLTRLGQPRHPLRLHRETRPTQWDAYQPNGQNR